MSQKQSKILIIDDKAASFVVFDAIFASSPFIVNLQATMEDFIFKSFNPQDLRERVEALVS